MNKEQNPTKASYHQPTFSIYGNLTKLTRTGQPGSFTDTGGGGMSMGN